VRLLILPALASIMFAQQPLIEGNAASPVRVLIYEDLQCPDCANFRAEMEKELLPRFAKTVAFEHRDFPLAKHSWARKASIAARFFATISPEMGIEFRRVTMNKLREIKPEAFDQYVGDFAAAHKIDRAKALALGEERDALVVVVLDGEDAARLQRTRDPQAPSCERSSTRFAPLRRRRRRGY
jgi:hypothetical protein